MILYSDSNLSKFTDVADNLNLWPAVKCGLSGTLFLAQQEQLLSEDNSFTKWLLHALLEPSHVS